MKVGDRVRLKLVRYKAMEQEVGDEGFISNFYWDDGIESCWGVTLDKDPIYVGLDDWSYMDHELEVIQ